MNFQEAIAALGTEPHQVSEKLRELGIKGYPKRSGFCPIAKYLNHCGFPEVGVTQRYIYRFDTEETEKVDVEAGVTAWITAFDDGSYPEFQAE